MKNLKLLNKKNLSIILLLFLFIGFGSQSQEPVDIWNVETKQRTETVEINENIKKKKYPKILFIKCSLKMEIN